MPTPPPLRFRSRGGLPLLPLLPPPPTPSPLALLSPPPPPFSVTSTRLSSSPSDTLNTLEAPPSPTLAVDGQGRSRLPWKKEGYSYWTWQNHQIHYVALGESREGGREEGREGGRVCPGRRGIVIGPGKGTKFTMWRYVSRGREGGRAGELHDLRELRELRLQITKRFTFK